MTRHFGRSRLAHLSSIWLTFKLRPVYPIWPELPRSYRQGLFTGYYQCNLTESSLRHAPFYLYRGHFQKLTNQMTVSLSTQIKLLELNFLIFFSTMKLNTICNPLQVKTTFYSSAYVHYQLFCRLCTRPQQVYCCI